MCHNKLDFMGRAVGGDPIWRDAWGMQQSAGACMERISPVLVFDHDLNLVDEEAEACVILRSERQQG